VSALSSLISELKEVCAGLPDQRKGPRRGGEYQVGDWVRIHIDYDLKRQERRE